MEQLLCMDFFAGIGGIRKGIMDAGKKHNIDIHSVGYSDIKKEAISVYSKLYPGDNNFGDITQINPSLLPDFDIFLGGFPCQSYSMAGKRGGLQDHRGQLIFNVFDIVEIKRPKLLFLENVIGLTTINGGQDIKNILEELSNIGYYCDFITFNSKNIGLPQSRQRAYFLGIQKELIEESQFQEIISNIKDISPKLKKKKVILDILEQDVTFEDIFNNDLLKKELILNDKEAKMTLLRDNFCGSIKGIDGVSNGVTKTYGKISGQSTKIVFDKKQERYLNENEVSELYEQFKEYSLKLKELKKSIKEDTSIDKTQKNIMLQNFFKSFSFPENLYLRIFSKRELGRLQGYSEDIINTVLDTLPRHGSCSSVFGDSVSVPVIEEIFSLFITNLKKLSII